MGKQYNVIDLFAWCGGLLEGFLKDEKEFYPVASVEWDKTDREFNKQIEKLLGLWKCNWEMFTYGYATNWPST